MQATKLPIGSHMGIDQKTVLVKKVGLKMVGERTDRQNEVWAGKPVNMAAKLASIADDNEMLVSDRFFRSLKKDDRIHLSCGCIKGVPGGPKTELWTARDVTDPRFDFKAAYCLKTIWCQRHGREFCEGILTLDK